MVGGSAGKLLLLEDFNVPEIDWICGAAPEVTIWASMLQFVHASRMVQQVIRATRSRFGQESSILDLMLTITPNDIGVLDLEKPTGGRELVAIRMRLSLQGLVAPDKYEWKCLGMDKSRLLGSGL